MDAELRTRAAKVADSPGITEVCNAMNMAEIGQLLTDESETRAALTNPDLDLSTDCVVVVDSTGRIVGYGTLWPDAPFTEIYMDNYVHPDRMGQGIGAALLDWAEARAGEVAAMATTGAKVVLRHGVWIGSLPAEFLFESRGYEVVRVFQHMEVTLAEPPPEPEWPEGVSFRSMVLGTDERVLYDVKQASFEDHWGGSEGTFEGWIHELTETDGFDPELVFLALDGDGVIGEAIGQANTPDNPGGGYLADLGVLRDHRGRGVATALLRQVFGELYRRGLRHITTGVDAESLTGANRLYERVGMKSTYGHSVYEREVPRTS